MDFILETNIKITVNYTLKRTWASDFQFWLCHVLPVDFWLRYLISLNLSLSICTVGKILLIFRLLWRLSEKLRVAHSTMPDTSMVMIIIPIRVRDLMQVYQNTACLGHPFTRYHRCPKIYHQAIWRKVNRKDCDEFENIG